MKTIIKKILMIYISLVLIFAPSSIVYAASPSGWAFNSFNVATSVVTALKGGASASVAVAKSPISQKIAKGILGGLIAGAALPLAISQLSGFALEAIDWVLDPANNAVKWKPKAGTKVGYYKVGDVSGNSPQDVCEKYINAVGGFGKITSIVGRSDQFCIVYSDLYPDGGAAAMWSFVETADYNWRSIPIPTVADKIYDNSKTHAESRAIVNDAVKEYVNEGSADTALDNAKTDTDATHGCGTGTTWNGSACVATPTTPDTPFDPSSILAAIASLFDAVMSLPDVINNALDDLLNSIKDFFQPAIDKVNDFVDWVKQEPPQDEAPKDVPVGDLSDVGLENQDRFQARIKFPSQCPSQQLTFNYFGRTYSHEIPFQALCQVLEMVAPVFVGVACLGVAFYIVREV